MLAALKKGSLRVKKGLRFVAIPFFCFILMMNEKMSLGLALELAYFLYVNSLYDYALSR